jgi:DNA-binding LacI/PurR family transcriptional regulator
MVMEKKANIYDVAKRAGVSHQTVSRVLNNHPNLKASTREKVEEAIRALHYRPSQAARQLVTSQSKLIGILLTESDLYGPSSILNAMEHEARSAGYSVLSISISADDPESWKDGVEQLRILDIDGLVTIALPKALVDKIAKSLPNVTFVVIDTEPSDDFDVINIDNVHGAKLAIDYLVELGHTAITHVTGPVDAYEAQMRKHGYELAMKKAKLKTEIIEGDWSIEAGYRIGKELTARKVLPTAIFCANDHLVLGVLKALHQSEIRVPEDICLIGFDNIPESAYFSPSLTTVKQDFNSVGRNAMSKVLSQLKESASRETIMIEPELLIRESTRPLKKKLGSKNVS